MAVPINDELASAWRALGSGASEEDGWRSISISGLERSRLQAARKFPENREAILIGFTSANTPPSAALPAGAGFRVEKVSSDLPGDWLALVRQEEGGLELFSRMATDVVNTVAANATRTHERQMQLFLGRVRAWQQFMSRRKGALDPEAELGLAGELVCLNRVIDAGMDMHAAVESWRGPFDGLQDFELGSGAIEVKSTLAYDGFPASIMSLEQLDDSTRQPLFLFGCRFEVATDGLSLCDRVRGLREIMACDPAAAARFENALLLGGFVDSDAEHYTRRLHVRDSRFLRVDVDFPRLVAANVHPAIRRVRYELDLDAISAAVFSLEDVLDLIGAT